MKKRIQITIEEDLDDTLEEFCTERHCTKSSVIGIATTEYIAAQKQLPDVIKQLDELKAIVQRLEVTKKK